MEKEKSLSDVINKLATDKSFAQEMDRNPVKMLSEMGVKLSAEAKEKITEFSATKAGSIKATNCSVSGYSCS